MYNLYKHSGNPVPKVDHSQSRITNVYGSKSGKYYPSNGNYSFIGSRNELDI